MATSKKPASGRGNELAMNELIFLFAVHNHQPMGNFPSVFRKAFQDCYRPFLKRMAKHPSIKFTLHFSGPLWEYMQSQEKECWEIVQELTEKRQVELLSGGFYEPILSIIPEEDRLGQVSLMNEFLKENFGRQPRGIWLTERVWEPCLPKILAKSGIEYTLLDEEHFHYAGIRNILLPYVTEDEGYPLVLFPINKKLRYMIPFYKLEEVHAYFKEIDASGGAAILGDDGEKFGLWPGTHRWVYEEGWLEHFLDFLDEQSVRTLTYSEYLDTGPPCGRVYIPPASYEEMMEWTLEPQDYVAFKTLKSVNPPEARRFLRGGFFREFFLKYSEDNHLHKRMLSVSRAVNQQGLGNPEARRELYKGQCNDAYWHGIFGGLYLPHLREAVYSHLLQAEKKIDLRQGWETLDYDLDRNQELLYRNDKFNLLFKPSFGGSLVELDYRPLSRNLSDVLSRREESYHRQRKEEAAEGKSIHQLSKELPAEAASLLRFDWHPRYSLLDHFLHCQTTQEDFSRVSYGEQGDFVNRAYDFSLAPDSLMMVRRGHVWADGERAPLKVQKVISTGAGLVDFRYEIENRGEKNLSLFFGNEWNFYLLDNEWELKKDRLVLLEGKLVLEFSPSPEVWHFPLQTLSQSEEGYDIIQQGVCFLPHWKFELQKKKLFFISITLRER